MTAPSPALPASVRRSKLPMLLVLLGAATAANAQMHAPLTGAMAQPLPPEQPMEQAAPAPVTSPVTTQQMPREVHAAPGAGSAETIPLAADQEADARAAVNAVSNAAAASAAASEPVAPAADDYGTADSMDNGYADESSIPPTTSPFESYGPMPAQTRTARVHHEIGESTRSLLDMQANGSNAGKVLPILGDEASRSYKRYIDSFEHPIPEKFEQAVQTGSGSGGIGG